MEITRENGAREVWMVEGGGPNTLLRCGANKNTFPVGTEVVVDGYQARDHSEKRANARDVTFPDRPKLFLGSLGALPIPSSSPPTRPLIRQRRLTDNWAWIVKTDYFGRIPRPSRRSCFSSARAPASIFESE